MGLTWSKAWPALLQPAAAVALLRPASPPRLPTLVLLALGLPPPRTPGAAGCTSRPSRSREPSRRVVLCCSGVLMMWARVGSMMVARGVRQEGVWASAWGGEGEEGEEGGGGAEVMAIRSVAWSGCV